MLGEAGLRRSECRVTNVCQYQPPNNEMDAWIVRRKTPPGSDYIWHQGAWCHPNVIRGTEALTLEIGLCKPDLILALGNTPLWALTGKTGITAWRGSQLLRTLDGKPTKILPSYHPAAILRQWSWRAVGVHDLRRAREWLSGDRQGDAFRFLVRPSFPTVMDLLHYLSTDAWSGDLAVDIETRGGQIACIGLAWSELDAICIPLLCLERPMGYWTELEEDQIIEALRRVLERPDVNVIGHNFAYDIQYLARQCGIWPKVAFDTMVAQHVCWAGLQKSLAFISSMYADHYVYWKEDGKYWDPRHVSEDQLWEYNCTDCVRTFECVKPLEQLLDQMMLSEQFSFQMDVYHQVFLMMLRGIKVDAALRKQLGAEIAASVMQVEQELQFLLERPLNVRSPKQMAQFFYEECGFPVIRDKHTQSPTTKDEALVRFAEQEPLIRCVTERIQAIRSGGLYLSNYIQAVLDSDGRMRTSLNITGTNTYRLSSSENPYGVGGNLQVIPGEPVTVGPITLPNIRSIFIPDKGKGLVEVDLKGADAQVVAAEAGDKKLLEGYAQGRDMHLSNAKDIFDLKIRDAELYESHPEYELVKKSFAKERRFAKIGVHATNYGCSARTLASHMGVTVSTAEAFQTKWFVAHPLIKEQQNSIRDHLRKHGYIQNKFGFRIYQFDRNDADLPEYLAWIPQSTVAIAINKILLALAKHPEVELLLQVHDSLLFQVPFDTDLQKYHHDIKVTIPYNPPLTIGCSVKRSIKSWGEAT